MVIDLQKTSNFKTKLHILAGGRMINCQFNLTEKSFHREKKGDSNSKRKLMKEIIIINVNALKKKQKQNIHFD